MKYSYEDFNQIFKPKCLFCSTVMLIKHQGQRRNSFYMDSCRHTADTTYADISFGKRQTINSCF